MKIFLSLLLIASTLHLQGCREAVFSSIKGKNGAQAGNGDSSGNNGNGDANGNGNGNNNGNNGDGGGGDGSGDDNPVSTAITVTVDPAQRAFGGEKAQASAVLKDGTTPAVTWTVSAPNGKDPGTIDDKGVYTSPATGNESYPVTVTATTKDGDPVTGSATIILVVPSTGGVTLIATLPVTELGIGGLKTQAKAELSDGTKNPPVTWVVTAPAGKDAGSIDGNGVYTSPATGNDRYQVVITATLIADTKIKGSVPLILNPSAKPELLVSVPVSKLNVGGEKTTAKAQLKDGTLNPPVTWTVSAPAGKDAGSIDANGVYTSPATGNEQYVVTITATLKADTSVKASVPLNIIPLKPELIVTLPTNEIKPGKVKIPAKAVLKDGTQNPPVTWTVSGPGGKDPGTINSSGIYTSPEKSTEKFVVTITATLIADPSVKASVPLTVLKGDDIFARCERGNVAFPIVADVYSLAEDTPSLPKDFSVLKKVTTVCMDQYNVPNREFTEGFPDVPNLFEWFSLHTRTTIIIPKAGTYTFRLTSDDGSKMWINGVLIVDNDGVHAEVSRTVSVTFTKAGEFPLVLDYFQGPRFNIALMLEWKRPGYSYFDIVPKEAFK